MISGFRASNIGQYGIGDFSWTQGGRIGSRGGYEFDPFTIGSGTFSPIFDDPILDAVGQIVSTWIGTGSDAPRANIPPVLPPLVWAEESLPVATSVVPPAVVPQATALPAEVIDPESFPDLTVYENAPAGIYETNRAETDWDEYYEQYVELNAPEPEVPEVWEWLQGATTIGQIGSEVGWWGGDSGLVAPSPVVQPGGPSGPVPAKLTVDTRTGKVTTCKRRRRRKLLTESDFNVLLRVATLPNKENVRIVLGKAIGRS